MNLAKIISGGQTGVDRGALDAALQRGFPCGGWCPSGRLAEDGLIPDIYPVTELHGAGYRQRTIRNVAESDATLIIYFASLSGGTEQTVLHCIRRQRPYKLIDASEVPCDRAAVLVANFVAEQGVTTLNVAGPRLSLAHDAHRYTEDVIGRLLDLIATAASTFGATDE